MNKYNLRILSLFVLSMVFTIGCQKYPGDSYNFSDSTGNYMIFASTKAIVLNKKVDATSGTHIKDAATINLATRVGFPYAVNYTYAYSIDGGKSGEGNGVYGLNTISGSFLFSTTDDMFPSGQNQISGTLILKNAIGKYGNLNIGYPDSTSGVKISFTAYKPGT